MDRRSPVSVISVTHNSVHCIASALQSVAGAQEMIVVDNASQDGSACEAERHATLVIRNQQNLGFGSACNIGAQLATQDLLLFLNPDAALRAGVLARLVNCAQDNPAAVAFGGRMELPEESDVDGAFVEQLARAEARAAGGTIAASMSSVVKEVATISGSVLLCRAAVFREIGGFDEGFFLYFEDEDLCRRLRQHGFLLMDEGAVYSHLPGSGAKLSARQKFAKYRHYGHSRVRFARKYGTGFRPIPAALEQGLKGGVAFVRGDVDRSSQHFGRALGYLEGAVRPQLAHRLP